jgi:hypothetical protein
MKAETGPRAGEEESEHFEIQAILNPALPDVAAFLHRWRSHRFVNAPVHSAHQRVSESALSLERRLRWLLVENPVVTENSPLGYCVRDRVGVIRGINLCFPSAFMAGNQRLLGLCSGSFFVEPTARSMGFYLFKKYLSFAGYEFHFATTCNPNSEPLWRMLGGRAVPDSETEYILPLRLDGMLSAFVATKTSSELASGIARIAGRCANPILRFLTQPSPALTIEPCQDWEKLSELYHRNRSVDSITSERSAEFLQWRYGPGSPVYPCGIYLFRDKQGNEGWFSMGNLIRGGIRGPSLLDVIWPHKRMSFKAIFQEILRLAPSGADALFFRRQPRLDYRELCRWAIPHNVQARTFVISPKEAPLMALDSFDYDDNDYVAWMFNWTGMDSAAGSVQLVKAG